MATSSDFYRSKEWRKLLSVLKMERQDENGQIICAYCGKPIVRAYDMIGHHVIHLTPENVNDADVALNPENIQLVHHRCHNYIHDKLGYSKREVFLVYGCPRSGKTTWVQENMNPGDLVVDLDNIWQCVSGLERYEKPAALKAVVFRVRDTLLDAVKYRLGRWNNAYIIGGFPMLSERQRMCKETGAREVYIECPRELAEERAEAMGKGTADVWKKYIAEWFEKYTPPAAE
ncbi:MAG: HNH endonuclease [Clostridia bacterium]|nr:HNH endonuclease [Clostridia bacterium]